MLFNFRRGYAYGLGLRLAQESVRWHQSGHNPWTGIMGGDGMQIQVDNRNPNIVYTVAIICRTDSRFFML